MHINPSAFKLSKDSINNTDIADYLKEINSNYDYLKNIKKRNTKDFVNNDSTTIEELKDENQIISEKLLEGVLLTRQETDVIIKTLKNILLIQQFNSQNNFNTKGIENYITTLKDSQ